MKLDRTAERWSYIWRTTVFHIVWILLSPIAALFTAPRSFNGIKRAQERRDMVYDSVYKKFVTRPRLNAHLRNISDNDLENLVWLAEEYPLSLPEVAEIWEANGKAFGATIKQLAQNTGRKN